MFTVKQNVYHAYFQRTFWKFKIMQYTAKEYLKKSKVWHFMFCVLNNMTWQLFMWYSHRRLGVRSCPPNVIRPCKHSTKTILIFKHELYICYKDKNGFQTIFTYIWKNTVYHQVSIKYIEYIFFFGHPFTRSSWYVSSFNPWKQSKYILHNANHENGWRWLRPKI
jgi:hypothetical protein